MAILIGWGIGLGGLLLIFTSSVDAPYAFAKRCFYRL
jgi:hypothetical protein